MARNSDPKKILNSGLFLGSEFVAMTHGVETLSGLRYKLRMMGVHIDGPTYGDKMSVIFNTSRPESWLKKKSNDVCYHPIRESVAMGECITTHIPTLLDFSDLLTKVLYVQRRRNLVDGIMFYIYEYGLNWIANSLCPILVCKFDWEYANLEGTVKYWPNRGSEYRAYNGSLKYRTSSDIIAPVCLTQSRALHFTSASWCILSEHNGCSGTIGTSFASYILRNALLSSSVELFWALSRG